MLAMEGIRALQARILTLEQQLGVRPAAAAATTSVTAAQAQDFDGLLQQALASLSPTAASTSASLFASTAAGTAMGTRSAAGTDLSAYANGQIPTSALTAIGGGEHLAGPAASAFEQMRSAAARQGVTFGVNDGYRDLADQHRLASELGLYSQGGLAAEPGTSTHGLGLSVDLDLDGSALAWMRANAGRFGFVNDVAGEPWHWTYEAGAS
jgi:LAS superfamily LD-carboxypeptidase LdcB